MRLELLLLKTSTFDTNVVERFSYWLFRAWGRIGTTIGNNKLDSGSREEMISLFKSLFEEKTANMWDNRNHFVKVPGKMVMIDISYADVSERTFFPPMIMIEDHENELSLPQEDTVDAGNAEISSKLPKPVADLVTMIFNITVMKNVMKELTVSRIINVDERFCSTKFD